MHVSFFDRWKDIHGASQWRDLWILALRDAVDKVAIHQRSDRMGQEEVHVGAGLSRERRVRLVFCISYNCTANHPSE